VHIPRKIDQALGPLNQAGPFSRFSRNWQVLIPKKPSDLTENRLLACLRRDEYDRLLPNLERVRFPKNRIIYEAAHEMRHAYFLNSGLVSLLAVADDGRTIQIGMVGSEGFVGLPIIHMAHRTPNRVMAQAPVDALRVDAARLLAEFKRSDKLREVLLRYSQALETQFVQSAICNPLHSTRQRISRWLLMSSDALNSSSLDLTIDQIAIMLGKHRNLVSVASRELQRKGLIEHDYGRITMLDRQGLEAVSCECYRIVKEWTAELLDS